MAPGAPTPAGPLRPSGWWYGFAAVVGVAGLAAGIVLIVVGFAGYVDKVDDFDRTSVPGTLEVEITDTGGYSIYHEHDTDDIFAPEPDVEVTSPSGASVVLDRYSTNVTYTAGDHEGEGLFTFDADEAGTYTVDASGGDTFGENGIAVGPGLGGGLVTAILGGLLVGFVGVVAGVVIAIVVAVRRGRYKRAQTAAAAVGVGPQGSPWWNAPPPPP